MFPYISDTGAMSPESNIFGQCLNIGAAMMFIVLYVRYRQIDYDIRTKNIILNPIWNKIGIILGFTASLGVSLVGNFSELSVLSVHMLGAFIAFLGGNFYFIVQTWISNVYFNSRCVKISKIVYYARLFIACLLIPLFISGSVFGSLSLERFHGIAQALNFKATYRNDFAGKSILWWTEEDGGYTFRLISVFSEWFSYLLTYVYVATFSSEFGDIESGEIIFKIQRIHEKLITFYTQEKN
ncbi:hypothetical protein FQR65_LT18873 [Abscondita terminalis]|nr:hypothetical protein FQR65_LT18873 [Abscondita terminalis]